MSVEQISVS